MPVTNPLPEDNREKSGELLKERAHLRILADPVRPDTGTTVAFEGSAATRGRDITASRRIGGYMAKDMNQRGIENQVKGTAKEVKGQVRGDVGDMTDDHSEHIKGRVEEVKGKIQKNFGKTQREVDENT